MSQVRLIPKAPVMFGVYNIEFGQTLGPDGKTQMQTQKVMPAPFASGHVFGNQEDAQHAMEMISKADGFENSLFILLKEEREMISASFPFETVDFLPSVSQATAMKVN